MKNHTQFQRFLALCLYAVCGCAATPAPTPVPPAPATLRARTEDDSTPPDRDSETSSTASSTTPPTENMGGGSDPARVRTIHACPEPAVAHIAAFADNSTTPFIPDLAYGSSTSYLEVPTGPHTIALRRPNASPSSPPLGSGNVPAIEAGHYYTVIAHGVSTAPPGPTVVRSDDTNTPPGNGLARFRFLHAIAGVPSVDACLVGVTLPIPVNGPAVPTFVDVRYGAWGRTHLGEQYYEVPTMLGSRVEFRRHADPPCSGQSLGRVSVTLQPGTVSTTVTIGSVARPRVQPELLVCTDLPRASAAQCNRLPLQP